MNAVSAQFAGVSKRYRRTVALRDMTLSVPKGSVFGLLGRNGSGKSTALRCLVGLERPDTGMVTVLDRDPRTLDVPMRQRIGYLSEDGVPFPAATAESLIRLCAPLYPGWNRTLEEHVLSRFQIDPRRKLRELSLGQRRAVALMLAVCPQPDLLILDEPAANLDAVIRRELLEMVLTLAAESERTVIFSSHILSDVERVADRVAILHGGHVLIERPIDELKEQVRRLRLMYDHDNPPAPFSIPGLLALRRAPREMLATVIGYDDDSIEKLAARLGVRIEVQLLGLDELFIDLVGDHDSVDQEASQRDD